MSETKPKCPVPECGQEMEPCGSNQFLCVNNNCLFAKKLCSVTREQLARITVAAVKADPPAPAPTLKPCPWCGGEATQYGSYVVCAKNGCDVYGPNDDRDGKRWNALPRAGEYGPDLIVFRRTGETRKPKKGEWFQCHDGSLDEASKDFEYDSLPILERIHPAPTRPRAAGAVLVVIEPQG